MLCSEIIAVCSQIHTKHINTLCGQNVELVNVKLAVHIVTIDLAALYNYRTWKGLRYEPVTALNINFRVFRTVTPYCLAVRHQQFRGCYSPHQQNVTAGS